MQSNNVNTVKNWPFSSLWTADYQTKGYQLTMIPNEYQRVTFLPKRKSSLLNRRKKTNGDKLWFVPLSEPIKMSVELLPGNNVHCLSFHFRFEGRATLFCAQTFRHMPMCIQIFFRQSFRSIFPKRSKRKRKVQGKAQKPFFSARKILGFRKWEIWSIRNMLICFRCLRLLNTKQ